MSNWSASQMDRERVRSKLSSLYALDRFESIDYGWSKRRPRRPRARPAPQELGAELRARRVEPRRQLRGHQPLQRGDALHLHRAERPRRRVADGHADRREPEVLHRVLSAAVAGEPLLHRAAVRFRGAQRLPAARSRPARGVSRAQGAGRPGLRARDLELGRDPLRHAPGHRPAARVDRRSGVAGQRVRSRRLFRALLLRQARQHFLPAPRPAVRVRVARRARERRRRTNFDIFRTSWLVARSFDRHTLDLLDRCGHHRRRGWRRRRTRSRSAGSSTFPACRPASWPGRTTASGG